MSDRPRYQAGQKLKLHFEIIVYERSRAARKLTEVYVIKDDGPEGISVGESPDAVVPCARIIDPKDPGKCGNHYEAEALVAVS